MRSRSDHVESPADGIFPPGGVGHGLSASVSSLLAQLSPLSRQTVSAASTCTVSIPASSLAPIYWNSFHTTPCFGCRPELAGAPRWELLLHIEDMATGRTALSAGNFQHRGSSRDRAGAFLYALNEYMYDTLQSNFTSTGLAAQSQLFTLLALTVFAGKLVVGLSAKQQLAFAVLSQHVPGKNDAQPHWPDRLMST